MLGHDIVVHVDDHLPLVQDVEDVSVVALDDDVVVPLVLHAAQVLREFVQLLGPQPLEHRHLAEHLRILPEQITLPQPVELPRPRFLLLPPLAVGLHKHPQLPAEDQEDRDARQGGAGGERGPEAVDVPDVQLLRRDGRRSLQQRVQVVEVAVPGPGGAGGVEDLLVVAPARVAVGAAASEEAAALRGLRAAAELLVHRKQDAGRLPRVDPQGVLRQPVVHGEDAVALGVGRDDELAAPDGALLDVPGAEPRRDVPLRLELRHPALRLRRAGQGRHRGEAQAGEREAGGQEDQDDEDVGPPSPLLEQAGLDARRQLHVVVPLRDLVSRFLLVALLLFHFEAFLPVLLPVFLLVLQVDLRRLRHEAQEVLSEAL
mmetsp:Transcript_54336/g.143060  ORF Transcript_54336/g.143060 Transcript_54336/m.143060 type:complete len:373 (+) Transcript_54336:1167-2285(+)